MQQTVEDFKDLYYTVSKIGEMVMRKLKVYLDTSVVSHLMQEDVPAKMADTLQLWELFRKGIYEVYVSTVTLEEISDCPEPKNGQSLR